MAHRITVANQHVAGHRLPLWSILPAAVLAAFLILLLPIPGLAADYFVSPAGSDSNPGTMAQPFRTLGHAVTFLSPGDTCYLREGTYREKVRLEQSGLPGQPIVITAWGDEEVVLSGTELVKAPWQTWRGRIMKTRVNAPVTQLFAKGKMMVEARWPNVTPKTLWKRTSWARAGGGSRYGMIIDPALAKTGINWTGARAVLNVGQQFNTWTRTVSSHTAGSNTFVYPRDLTGIGGSPAAMDWDDDYYFLFGVLGALDAPGEWFQQGSDLYFMPPGGINLQNVAVEGKIRDLAIHGKNLQYVEIRGLTFFAATISIRDSVGFVVENNRFLYPNYNRDLMPPGTVIKSTQVSGNDHVIRGNMLRYSGLGGFKVIGEGNLIEGNVVRDVAMFGGMEHAGIKVIGEPAGTARGSTVSGNTIFNGGSTLITFRDAPHIVEWNHVYNGGLLSNDFSLIYTQAPETWGSVIRYNWVHGCRGDDNGMGIRGDDQTRGLTVHHNVVWDCSHFGLEIKGDENRIFNNTVFGIRRGDRAGYGMLIYIGPEPRKPWRDQAPLLPAQNRNSEVRNNAMTTMIIDGGRPMPIKYRNIVTSNYVGDLMLEDPANFDFRPASHSPLVDAGEVIPGITGAYFGPFPDIGAYDYGLTGWVPGAP